MGFFFVCVQRGTRNKTKEDFLTNLRRLTLVHQRTSGGDDFFRFEPGCVPLYLPIVLSGLVLTTCSYFYLHREEGAGNAE